jgi:fructokinase
MLWGGVEAGGTHFMCAVGSGPDDLRAEERFPTTTPSETIARAIEFFHAQRRELDLAAIGIASFGPVDIDPSSATYGFVTSTPKPGWAGADIAGPIGRALGTPVGFDTDVNGAALAEHEWGAARGLDDFVYITVGTGIGGGAMVNGRLLHGLVHPEMGHMRTPRQANDEYRGYCPFHGDCLEGLASGPAMQDRWGVPPEEIPEDHPAWELEADYLALALANIVGILSPRRIVIGGGVMRQPRLLPLIRRKVQDGLSGYIQAPELLDHIDRYIVPPALGRRAGVLGAIALGKRAARNATARPEG